MVNIPTFTPDDLVLPEHLEFIFDDDASTFPSFGSQDSMGLIEAEEGSSGFIIPVDDLTEAMPEPIPLRPGTNINTTQPGAWFDPHDGTLQPPGQDLYFEDGYVLNPEFIPEAIAITESVSGANRRSPSLCVG